MINAFLDIWDTPGTLREALGLSWDDKLHKEASMTAQDSDHDKARELAEKALDKLVEGDEAAGDKLIKQAEKIDPTAIDEVAEDLDISDDDIEQAQDSGKGNAQK
jgi:hypothetical protein